MGTGVQPILAAGGASLHRPSGFRTLLRQAIGGAAWAVTLLFLASTMLLAAGPRLHFFQLNWVRSGSMAPAMPQGSLTVLTPVRAQDLRVGDVISYQRPVDRELVTHRIVAVESDADGSPLFTTKGDANGAADPGPIHLSGTGWKLAYAVPYAGYAVGYGHTPAGRYLLIGVPLVLLGLLLAVEILRRPAGEDASRA